MVILPDFKSWQYILEESDVQRSVKQVLEDSGIFSVISGYSPVICGSYPLDIALPGSDVDISCYAPNLESYIYFALEHFKEKENFYLKIKEIRNEPSVIVRFTHHGQLIELFTQKVPVEQQHGFLHLVTEWHILRELGKKFREQLMALRESGLKTEPAFAHLLRLKGDPYLALIDYGLEKGYIQTL